MAHRLVGASGTGVLLADAMTMHPAVVAWVRSLWRSPPSPWRPRWRPQCWGPLGTRHRIHQFLVGCGERADGGRESQIGQRELLEDGSVVRCGKCEVECRLQPSDCRSRRREHPVSLTKWFPPPKAKI